MSPSCLPKNLAKPIVFALTFIVFFFLDFLDSIFCVIYKFLDEFFEGKPSSCYCVNSEENVGLQLSDTLYRRPNVFRQMGFAGKSESCRNLSGGEGNTAVKWSDCGCEYCVCWMKDGGAHKLHLVVKQPSLVINENWSEELAENVIFLHGFLSSSSFWRETVFPNLSETAKHKYRLFAVDLLGFGRSPKPKNCLYTLDDHMEMIEKTVIEPFELKSFHLVAHSMGCVIALSLAAKYSDSVKSITLIAPPYFPSCKEEASLRALERLAGKKLWPPLLFGSSFMSWYEHLGRFICLIFCRNHWMWERILKLFTRRRDLHFLIVDLTKHTHHSAWHTMHNVVCGGAKFMDENLDRLIKSRVRICVIHGDRDIVVPLECSYHIQDKVIHALVNIVPNADHRSVILGREKDFTLNLERFWSSSNS